jgi:hypothetical protein
VAQNAKLAAPYASFSSFLELLDKLRNAPRPPKVTYDALGGKAGRGTFGHLVTALKYFRLLEKDGTAGDQLMALAKSDDRDRRSGIKHLLTEHYSFLFDTSNGFDLDKATIRDLREKFTTPGASSSVPRRSASFFASAAYYAGIPLPNIRPDSHRSNRHGVAGSSASARREMVQMAVAKATKNESRNHETSDKEFGRAMLELLHIFKEAQTLSRAQREDLARAAVDMATLLIGK